MCTSLKQVINIAPVWYIQDEKVSGNEEIEQDKESEEIRQDAYSLPGGFTWDTLDIRDPLIVRLLNMSITVSLNCKIVMC